MTHSTQNPIPPAGDNHKPPLKRLLRKLVPPPGANPAPASVAELAQGDDLDHYHEMLAQAHALSQHPNAFHHSLAQWLAAEGFEYNRNRRFRAAARNLQIEDDRDRLATLYEEIDDDHRQYFAEIELAANPAQRAIRRDGEIAFRRSLRLHSEIIHTARLARR